MAALSKPKPLVERVDRLHAGRAREISTLAEIAGATDGTEPLSESVLLAHQLADGTPVVHLTIRDPDGALAGYAYLDHGGTGGEASLELVVHPMRRRRGLGRALVEAAIAAAPDGGLLAWAHGDHPSAAALALDLGFHRSRELWQLRRPLPAEPAEPGKLAAARPAEPAAPALPVGVSLRAFRPGADDEPWLALNRLAFADHPEQGRWTAADLRVRMSEPWFDPAGFLLAVEDATGRLLGFHWTKVHRWPAGSPPRESDGPPSDDAETIRPTRRPMGEVYVLGVDPAAHGLGLGRALTTAGLRHLRRRGLDRVMLYVDESNSSAVALYTRLGFARWSTHVQYRRG